MKKLNRKDAFERDEPVRDGYRVYEDPPMVVRRARIDPILGPPSKPRHQPVLKDDMKVWIEVI